MQQIESKKKKKKLQSNKQFRSAIITRGKWNNT